MDHQEGVTLGELWRAVRKRIWVILIVSVLAVAISVTAFHFVLNPISTDYRLDFVLSYPDSGSLKFPDGTPFYYQDLISLSVLEEAKASDARFSKIDVAKMVEEDDIHISAEMRDVEGTPQYTGKYTLSAQSSYFASHSVATAFLRTVANIPVERAKEKAGQVDHLLEKAIFKGASFADRIELLITQRETLLEQYDEWIELFRSNYTVEGKTLKNHRAELAVIFGETTQEQLKRELKKYGYVPSENLSTHIAELRAERAMNEATIKEIREAMQDMPATAVYAASPSASSAPSTSSSSTQQRASLSETLAALIVRNLEIDAEIAALTEENVATFEARVDTEYEKLQAEAMRMQAVATVLYRQESRADFDTANAVKDGGTSLVAAGLGGFIAAFLIASMIVCIVEVPRNRKEGEGTGKEDA